MSVSPPARLRHIPFAVVAKPTGAACNLDCTYCFFLSKELLYDATGPISEAQWMSEAGLETYLANLLASHPDGPVDIAWQGGEPTLHGLPFFRRAVELAERLRRPRQEVQHAIQTNGTLRGDAWGEFLAEHRFLVGLSVDGPARLHDACRVSKAGRGTHHRSCAGGRRCCDGTTSRPPSCARSTPPTRTTRRRSTGTCATTSAPGTCSPSPSSNASLPRRFLWPSRGGAQHARSPRGAVPTARRPGHVPQRRPHRLRRLPRRDLRRVVGPDVGEVFVQDCDVALGDLFGRYSLCVRTPQRGTATAVEHNGNVYACDHYVEPDYLLGNVATDRLADLVLSPAQRRFGHAKSAALPGQCRACPVRWACHGGCPKDRFDTTPDGEPGFNYLCAVYHRFFTHAQPTLERIGRLLRSGRPASDIMSTHQTGSTT
ncbi:radical SAM/SPASM domain-containing protein [Xylanimonas protaetiae]|uniref:radical SAM/SPASM domain-containing protein n=1 Tax=Xylanimonas protaetiae TaxID=2509457 RepID=UPI001A91BCB4|nr:SPASM domain-containing protein [Xylanimonas protaetiae]